MPSAENLGQFRIIIPTGVKWQISFQNLSANQILKVGTYTPWYKLLLLYDSSEFKLFKSKFFFQVYKQEETLMIRDGADFFNNTKTFFFIFKLSGRTKGIQ